MKKEKTTLNKNAQNVNKSVSVDIKEDLKEIYPEVFEDNKINFEKLKSLLSGEIIEKEDDRFYFNWAGKSGLYKIIQSPAYGTLKPDKERSVDFDNTENIVIVGENLETLKLLLKPYFGKIKMIYIDPPYNTGKDFIYRDNFKEPLKDYLEKTGQIDSEGKKLTTNTEVSGRYHSDWLNFIYPRLFFAKSLLKDDGVIFVSIDDHEVHNLRKIMDEIFGEENLLAELIWDLGTGTAAGHFTRAHEYVVTYAKNKTILPNFQYRGAKDIISERAVKKISKGNPASQITFPAGIEFEGNNAVFEGEIGKSEKIRIISGKMIFKNGKLDKQVTLEAGWAMRDQIISWLEGKETFDSKGQRVLRFYFDNKGRLQYEKERGFINPQSVIRKIASTRKGSEQIERIFGKKIIEFPKPLELLIFLVKIVANRNDIILDFFAGSGTTGHAVWDSNKKDGGNRKFILIQIDEEVQNKEIKKEFRTVADICVERLRRVSEKYKKEIASASPRNNINDGDQDFGFKVFKLDKSNFNLKDEFEIQEGQDVEELKKKYLEWLGMFVNQPLVSGWQKIDVIYEVMLKEGLNLNSKIERVKIKKNNFYYVKDKEQNLEFYICLEDLPAPGHRQAGKIKNETIEEIRTSKYKGKMFVFLDKALTDNDKINLSTFVRLKVI
jgi:adenine-specific DNA-methyltransferase